MTTSDVEAEHSLRLEIWGQLVAEGTDSVLPGRLRDLGVFGGAQGIWVDKGRTGPLTPDGAGIAVAVLHTGRTYADDLSDDELLYHYPKTRRPASRDAGEIVEKSPKTEAGRRTVAVPPNALPTLRDHLDRHVESDPDALILDQGYRSLRTAWDNARKKTGLSYHLHDLRHAGLTYIATAGATTAELMHRAGHASPQAALRYQHATEERDKVLADALAQLIHPSPIVAIELTTSDSARPVRI